MIYICPTCQKEYRTEEDMAKHFLKCWKDNNSHHRSKPAPRGEDITTSEVSEDIKNFFASLKGE